MPYVRMFMSVIYVHCPDHILIVQQFLKRIGFYCHKNFSLINMRNMITIFGIMDPCKFFSDKSKDIHTLMNCSLIVHRHRHTNY